jgi:hypothetical protein
MKNTEQKQRKHPAYLPRCRLKSFVNCPISVGMVLESEFPAVVVLLVFRVINGERRTIYESLNARGV